MGRDYLAHTAVEAFDLRLEPGQVVGLLGQNGAGKSTILRMLSGCLAPSRGHIRISGIDLLEFPVAAKRAIGYLPDQPPLYAELRVDEYLRHCARLRRVSRRDLPEAVNKACRRCGLQTRQHSLIGALSKGFQQRVGIAQAIVHEPSLVILDEPTVGLDPLQLREVRALIAELGRHHGVILSTHMLAEVQSVCSHVVMMNTGRVVHASPLSELAAGNRPSCFRIRLARPPDSAVLAAIEGVARVEILAADTFRLHTGDEGAPLAAISEQACLHNWGLRELCAEGNPLEQLFVELTVGGDRRRKQAR